MTHYPSPQKTTLSGHHCTLIPFNHELDFSDLYQAFTIDVNGEDWRYLPYGPFDSKAEFHQWLQENCFSHDPLFYAIQKDDLLVGMTSFLNISPANGVIEIGHIHFAPTLQKTTAATEALYLMMQYAFDTLGYRRLEWKCDNANERSKRAAQRLGFTFEGLFRQHRLYKGRNRDTTWFSVIDKEWPELSDRFNRWLSPDNFDQNGRQVDSL